MIKDPKEKVIRPTTVFGDTYNIRSLPKLRKQLFKQQLLTGKYRAKYVDHPKTFAQKDKGQRGPARKEQTFLVSFTYKGAVSKNELDDFAATLKAKWSLRVHYEPCLFLNQSAWQLVIADTDVTLQDAVDYARFNIEKQ